MDVQRQKQQRAAAQVDQGISDDGEEAAFASEQDGARQESEGKGQEKIARPAGAHEALYTFEVEVMKIAEENTEKQAVHAIVGSEIRAIEIRRNGKSGDSA